MRRFSPVLVLAVVSIAFDSDARGQGASFTTRVNESATGIQGDDHSVIPVMSRDTRFIAFASLATNLVPNDGNGFRDVFRKDRLTGDIVRVSVDSNGGESNGGSGSRFGFEGHYLTISHDGRHVVFWSDASNLVAGDTNGVGDVFARDLVRGTTTRISVASDGTEATTISTHCAVSGDGRFVAFVSDGLVPGDSNPGPDIYVRDRDTDGDGIFDEPGQVSTDLVSLSSANVQADAPSDAAWISASGRWVTFRSEATNLVSGDNNGTRDWFVRDLIQGTTVRANVSSSGAEDVTDAPGFTVAKTSDDGRHVVFTSGGSTLVTGDTNFQLDIFVRDRDPDGNGVYDEGNGRTERVSVRADGSEVPSPSEDADISADGRFVVYGGDDHGGANGDVNASRDIYIFDRDANGDGIFDETTPGAFSVEALSLTPSGQFPITNSGCYSPIVSEDGGYVVFHSYADDIVVPDANFQLRDILLHKRFGIRLASSRRAAQPGDQIDFTVWDGEPGGLAGVFLTEINELPVLGFGVSIVASAFDAQGRFDVPFALPQTIGTAISSATFRAATLDSLGRIVISEPRRVSIDL